MLRFIQVGVGGFGRVWGGLLHDDRATRMVGLVDVSSDALNAAVEAGGYDPRICFGSLAEALRSVEADAVVVSTPPEHHCRDVVTAMRAGLDVISEKPMANSMADCRRMLKAAVETGRTYVVSQNYRYNADMWTLAGLVRGGSLGAVGQVKMDFQMGVDFGGGFRHSMAYPLIVDMSIHHFDLIRFVTGLDPVRVRATAWNPPWSNYDGDCSSTVLFTMANGARVAYNGSWCVKGQFTNWNGNWQIECEKGTVVYDNGAINVCRVPELYRVKSVRAVKPKPPRRQGQGYVLHDFMDAVAGKERAKTDVYDNIHSVGMVFATVRAMDSGREVKIMDAATEKLLA